MGEENKTQIGVPNLDLVTKEKGAREMTENLLPCPFCGSEELRISGVMGSYYVKCQECGCEQNMADGFDKAIAAWNRRTSDVVRCGECSFFDTEVGNCNQFEHLCSESDYCGWAVRKEVEND